MKKRLHIFEKIQNTVCRFLMFGIRPVFLVFIRDLKTIARSISVIIIMVGLCLLPSLYAWINIYACWDPYSNTGNLPVAVVNKDQGTVYNGKVINVGKSVIEELEKNESIGWDFVSEWQGNYGLNEGKYYALIEIPDDFSSKLVTLATSTPQKPAISYRVNMKLNSIATKITDAAKNKLISTIKTSFVKTVTEEALNELKSEINSSNLKTSRIRELKNTLTQTNSDIARLKKHISAANEDSEKLQQYLNQCITTLPKVTEQLNSLQNITDANKSLTQQTKQTIQTISSDLNADIQNLTELNNRNQQMISTLQQINSNSINKDVIGVMEQCSSLCNSVHIMLKADAEQIRTLNANYKLTTLSLLESSLKYADRLVVSERDALDKQIPLLRADTSKASINAALNSLSEISNEITKQTQDVSNNIQVNGRPLLNSLVDSLNAKLDDANNLAELGKAIQPQLNALAVFGGASSRLSVSQANRLNDNLTTLQNDLDRLNSKIDDVTIEDIDQLIDLTENNPSEISDFLSSPIEVKEETVYNTDTFGAGLTPFYTVLAIWVGALLSCALLTVECENTVGGIKLNLKQKHFGKMLLFLSLSLIQSTIVTLGDVFLLGVNPADFGLLMGISVLTSITFTVMIFTLVSLFGNVGKAIAMVMMVFQIAGAGGIYPIQTNPEIFGKLQPLWPFTYAINCYREAIAGPVWSSVQYNIRALLIFLGTFLILAVLKKPFHKLNTRMEEIYQRAQI
ncbi:YhgE/Pip domain-containing protein [Caproiciproducens galactitolivorans]|uniref:ABC-2 family transporter protein n=1 Tax=Caproiciproducens galactitolivorans TaxID=642589 RepID=A0A4Z0YII9_9FIRM|nr:YhgE/Pip domain-containing protein [Caproiciproducens galactitolivorans]QEY35705.1 YhgE/Pip domain-containing protein [Caproiciproducens galactitolivorans]TGJ77436.1 ABC-2 family transporter protein [Caproiciproducens galactitolivorans]